MGVTGRNINWQPVGTGAANQLLFLPNSGTVVAPITCGAAGAAGEPSPNSIIRIARLRDNPSSLYNATKNSCTPTQSGYDYWPLALYDTREGISRDNALPNSLPDNTGGINNRPEITAEGVMDYIELDVSNLQRWFAGAIPAVGPSGGNASNVGGYEVYFSDRRGNQVDPVTGLKEGAFGFNDIINGKPIQRTVAPTVQWMPEKIFRVTLSRCLGLTEETRWTAPLFRPTCGSGISCRASCPNPSGQIRTAVALRRRTGSTLMIRRPEKTRPYSSATL